MTNEKPEPIFLSLDGVLYSSAVGSLGAVVIPVEYECNLHGGLKNKANITTSSLTPEELAPEGLDQS